MIVANLLGESVCEMTVKLPTNVHGFQMMTEERRKQARFLRMQHRRAPCKQQAWNTSKRKPNGAHARTNDNE